MDDSLDLIILMILACIITFVLGWCIGDGVRNVEDIDLYCKSTQQTVQSYIQCKKVYSFEEALKTINSN